MFPLGGGRAGSRGLYPPTGALLTVEAGLRHTRWTASLDTAARSARSSTSWDPGWKTCPGATGRFSSSCLMGSGREVCASQTCLRHNTAEPMASPTSRVSWAWDDRAASSRALASWSSRLSVLRSDASVMARALPIRAARAAALKVRVARRSVFAHSLRGHRGLGDTPVRPRDVKAAIDGSTGGMSPSPDSTGYVAVASWRQPALNCGRCVNLPHDDLSIAV